MKKENFGFTLIELLIVVAIIAILAAIAIPNFLAAQTRAKVSRAKGEMKTLATALESYNVDNSCYPDDLICYTATDSWPWYVPDAISTPIAYISNNKIRDLMRPSGYSPGSAGDRYRYINYDVEVACVIASSMTPHWSKASIPGLSTAWPGTAANAAKGRGNYGKWRLSSCGPDGTAGPAAGTYKGVTIPAQYDYAANDLLYDPTNGTASWGDIIRSQKEADHRTEYPDLSTMPQG
jgi:prepilin-type N-terminal cleavage/methylation domain-containing protein